MSLKKYFQKDFAADELKVLKKLGIELAARPDIPRDKVKQTTAPTPYILKTITHCKLCKSDTTQYYSMELDEEEFTPCLRARSISEGEVSGNMKSQDLYPSTCPVCLKELMKWKKEDLAKTLIKAFPLANR